MRPLNTVTTRMFVQFTRDRSSLPPVLDELDQTIKDLQCWLIEEFQFRKIRANMFRVARVSVYNLNIISMLYIAVVYCTLAIVLE